MRFSIVTPSFRNSRWLKLCIPSVADQGVELEHIVQDSCSDDGTQDWLPKDKRVKAFIEKDQGMYDAVNRGLRRASGEIMAYINCDEQYLPGALRKVEQFFREHPTVDVVFGNTVVVTTDGNYICHRKAVIPTMYHTWLCSSLSVFTCSTFFRRRVIDELSILFNAKLRDVGDADWVMRLLAAKVRMALIPEFTSTFTITGQNMNALPNAQREKKEMFNSAPLWARQIRLAFIAKYRLERLLKGVYFQRPFSYSIYTEASPSIRQEFQVTKPTARWVDPVIVPQAV